VSIAVELQDCWLIVHGQVVDFSSLIPGAPSELVDPILANAGQDVSHWFMKRDDGFVDVSAPGAGMNRLFTLCAPGAAILAICHLGRAFAAAEIMGQPRNEQAGAVHARGPLFTRPGCRAIDGGN
jgi:hypothetical protein